MSAANALPDPNFVTVVFQLPADPNERKALIASFDFGGDRGYMGGTCTAMSMGDVITQMEEMEAG